MAFSDATPPLLGWGTYGVITATNGLTVALEDVDPGTASSRVRIAASGTGSGPVEVKPCGLPMTLYLDSGDTVTVDCGSVTIVVEGGNGVTVATGQASIGIPQGATTKLDSTAAGETTVGDVSGGTVTVTVDGVTVAVPAGQSGIFSTTNRFIGFEQPVDMTGYNKAKTGSAIPLKWRILNATGSPVSTIRSATVSVKPSGRCGFGSAGDDIETYVAANQSTLRNLGNGYYQFDWKTAKEWANTCKEIVVNLDGAIIVGANPAFQFK